MTKVEEKLPAPAPDAGGDASPAPNPASAYFGFAESGNALPFGEGVLYAGEGIPPSPATASTSIPKG
jgi:hypothetical protein